MKIRLGSIESSTEELKQLAEEIGGGPQPDEGGQILRRALERLIAVAEALETDNVTIEGLRALFPDAPCSKEASSSAGPVNKE
jgi:hypothetical protein